MEGLLISVIWDIFVCFVFLFLRLLDGLWKGRVIERPGVTGRQSCILDFTPQKLGCSDTLIQELPLSLVCLCSMQRSWARLCCFSQGISREQD